MSDRSAPRLEMVGIEKRFGGVQALRGAHLRAYPGEILGLCGENGAGKSTLLKVLSGVHPCGSYSGTLRLEGKELRLRNTVEAQRAGIAIVHQELMLVPELSVAANLFLGREPRRFGLLDEPAARARARVLLERFEFAAQIDPAAPVGELGIGLQQVVEIVRALSFDARVLVLDEPTAALTTRESDRLLGWLRTLREKGTTCVYVSHRLDEVFAVCDRITVMRDGRTVRDLETNATTTAELIQLMVGRSLEARGSAGRGREGIDSATASATACESGSVETNTSRSGSSRTEVATLEVVGLSLRRRGPSLAGNAFVLCDVTLSVDSGEIVGVCGAMGSGRTALLSTLFGCAEGEVSGQVRVWGARWSLAGPEQAIAFGVALLPEDRKGRGLVLEMSVAENLALPWLASPDVMGRSASYGWVDGAAERLLALRRIRELRIRGDADTPVGSLSGGNQQKVVLGKWLERPPRVLLLDEPTRGVDVGAREEIYALLSDLTAKGTAILLASSDLAEVRRLAHRVLVLRQGRIVSKLDARDVTENRIVELSSTSSTFVASPALVTGSAATLAGTMS